MKILFFKQNDKFYPGILTNKGIVNVSKISNEFCDKLLNYRFLTNRELDELHKLINSQSDASTIYLQESDLVIGPCVPNPSKIICIGLNYRKHAEESGMAIPTVPIIFTKYSNTLVDYGHTVVLGQEGEQFDYEVELGVVIGKKCKNVSEKDALNYVFGYCTSNDLSCRDLQFKTSQWLLGKSLDQFLPLGKYIVTGDEVGDPQQLQLLCYLNGEERQNSNTSDMIFPVATLIEFISRFMTLEPGDLILTGTPAGVIMGLEEKKWLKPGDKIKVEIEKLGYTENIMV